MSKRSGKHRESAKQYEDYPDQEYPDQEYPAQQYPAQQYPAQQYPAQQYPAQQYPAQQYPAQQYPAQQYPAQQYPAQQYPAHGYIYEECDEYPDPFYSDPRPDNQPTTSDQDLSEQFSNTHLNDNEYQARLQTSASVSSVPLQPKPSYSDHDLGLDTYQLSSQQTASYGDPYSQTGGSLNSGSSTNPSGRSQKGRRDSSSRNNPPARHSKDNKPRTNSFAGGSKDVPRSSTRDVSEANGSTYTQEDQEGGGSGEPAYYPNVRTTCLPIPIITY